VKDRCEDEIPLKRTARQAAGRQKKEVVPPPPRIPRITRLMALAIKFQEMINRGEVRDYAEVARLALVSRARITQVMNLLNLPPQLLDNVMLDPNQVGVVGVSESRIRRITSLVHWQDQIAVWEQLGADPRRWSVRYPVEAEYLAQHSEIGCCRGGTPSIVGIECDE